MICFVIPIGFYKMKDSKKKGEETKYILTDAMDLIMTICDIIPLSIIIYTSKMFLNGVDPADNIPDYDITN